MTIRKGSHLPKRELRTNTATQPMTARTTSDGKQVAGYAIVWNSPSVDLGGFTEICTPNMLDRTLRENPDVLLLRDHKNELLLARTTAKTLTLKVDSTGLRFEATLPDTAIANDTYENVRARNLTGNSFGFSVVKDSWAEVNGQLVRTLLDVDLYECSITSFPAYEATSVSTRSCPKGLLSKLRKKKDDLDSIILDDSDDDDDSDEDDDEDRCACPCAECAAGDCDDCSDEYCTDENCEACPMQDESRADHLRVRTLFARRMDS